METKMTTFYVTQRFDHPCDPEMAIQYDLVLNVHLGERENVGSFARSAIEAKLQEAIRYCSARISDDIERQSVPRLRERIARMRDELAAAEQRLEAITARLGTIE